MVVIISQMALMSLMNLQTQQSTTLQAGVMLSTPCPKSIQLQSIAKDLCKAASNIFVNAESVHISFYNNNKILFFRTTFLLRYINPIYSIDKPPKH